MIALLRFQLNSGARIGLRWLLPIAVALFVVPLFLAAGDTEILRSISRILYPKTSLGLPGSPLIVVLVFGCALLVARPVAAGTSGSLRHLPFSTKQGRLASTLATSVAISPIILWLGLFLVARTLGATPSPGREPRLIELLLAIASLALVVLGGADAAGGDGWLGRGVSLMACFLAATFSWPGMLGAIALGAISWFLPWRPITIMPRWSKRTTTVEPRGQHSSQPGFLFVFTLRAIGLRRLLGGWLGALAVFALSIAFLSNNRLAPSIESASLRLFTGLSIAAFLAHILAGLARTRPSWSWERSLPASARDRVGSDVLVFVLLPLPLLVAAIAWAPSRVAPVLPPMLLVVVWAALRSAGLARVAGSGTLVGGASRLLAEGSFVAALVALLPWTSLLVVPIAPWLLAQAAHREQANGPSRWRELSRRPAPVGR